MPSVTQIRVRYKDTDTMSVVYYGNYLTYFEVGRVEYLRERTFRCRWSTSACTCPWSKPS